jgi:hypothetical protein
MADGTPQVSGLGKQDQHFALSRLLIGCAITAIAATGGLIVVTILAVSTPGPPPGRLGAGPPPPPPLDTLAILIVVTGLCVLAWLAVLVVFARDQVLARLNHLPGLPGADLSQLREELVEDRRAALAALEEKITELTTEYGEQRETDGYLHGVRTAASDVDSAQVRQIRRIPAP